jgi:hypothetical protein
MVAAAATCESPIERPYVYIAAAGHLNKAGRSIG